MHEQSNPASIQDIPALLSRLKSSTRYYVAGGVAQPKVKVSKKERLRQKKASKLQERQTGSDDDDLGVQDGASPCFLEATAIGSGMLLMVSECQNSCVTGNALKIHHAQLSVTS